MLPYNAFIRMLAIRDCPAQASNHTETPENEGNLRVDNVSAIVYDYFPLRSRVLMASKCDWVHFLHIIAWIACVNGLQPYSEVVYYCCNCSCFSFFHPRMPPGLFQ